MSTKAIQREVVLISGSSSGIGKATARLLLTQGYTVYAFARRIGPMEDLEAQGARVFQADIRDEGAMQHILNTIREEQGRLDVLVNNAGMSVYCTLEETPDEWARQLFEVNIFSLARLTHLALPLLRMQKGKVILIGSLAGKIPLPASGWYSASKHALEAMADAWRMELRQGGVRVSLIEPEIIQTPIAALGLEVMKTHAKLEAYRFFHEHTPRVVAASMDMGVHPDIAAKTILKAVRARYPKPRYVTPGRAAFLPFLRAVLPDVWLDRIVLHIYRVWGRPKKEDAGI